jgi:hypothetical protein
MVCVLLAVNFVWASQIGLTVGGSEIPSVICGALLPLSAAYRRLNRGIADIIANVIEAFALWTVFCATLLVLSYLAASCAFPSQDVMIERLDRAVGFDWLAWRNVVLTRPILRFLLYSAYVSPIPQVLIAIIYFPVTGRSARIGELLLLAGATGVAAVLISAILPTLGPAAAYGGGDVVPVYLRDLRALRAGGPWHFELSAMTGIITMPSYHTIQAVLFTYAFRRTGLVGYGIATLNLVMLLSISPIGGHYLVDMLVGGMLAFGAIAVQRAPWHRVSRVLSMIGNGSPRSKLFSTKPPPANRAKLHCPNNANGSQHHAARLGLGGLRIFGKRNLKRQRSGPRSSIFRPQRAIGNHAADAP